MRKYRQLRNVISALSIIEHKKLYEGCCISFLVLETGLPFRKIARISIEESLDIEGRMVVIDGTVRIILSAYLSSRLIRYYNVYQNYLFLTSKLEERVASILPLANATNERSLQNEWIKIAFKTGLHPIDMVEATGLSIEEVSQFSSTKSTYIVRSLISHYMSSLG